ncbi:hypothetical protein [Pseudooceanicola nanhaiensis]|uniref:hypothetical protein n=1 Tax=Pseudooceanicola nanhaiensis TaxID=375761 RepID=UPI003511365B
MWRELEAKAKALDEAFEAAARSRHFNDADIESWGDVHDSLQRRPRITRAEVQ